MEYAFRNLARVDFMNPRPPAVEEKPKETQKDKLLKTLKASLGKRRKGGKRGTKKESKNVTEVLGQLQQLELTRLLRNLRRPEGGTTSGRVTGGARRGGGRMLGDAQTRRFIAQGGASAFLQQREAQDKQKEDQIKALENLLEQQKGLREADVRAMKQDVATLENRLETAQRAKDRVYKQYLSTYDQLTDERELRRQRRIAREAPVLESEKPFGLQGLFAEEQGEPASKPAKGRRVRKTFVSRIAEKERELEKLNIELEKAQIADQPNRIRNRQRAIERVQQELAELRANVQAPEIPPLPQGRFPDVFASPVIEDTEEVLQNPNVDDRAKPFHFTTRAEQFRQSIRQKARERKDQKIKSLFGEPAINRGEEMEIVRRPEVDERVAIGLAQKRMTGNFKHIPPMPKKEEDELEEIDWGNVDWSNVDLSNVQQGQVLPDIDFDDPEIQKMLGSEGTSSTKKKKK